MPFLTKDNFKERWESSKTYMGPFFDPLSEYERIARNRPYPGINKAYPKNTDGTMAGIVDSLPKRVIQQLPSGKVETVQGSVMSVVANFILYSDIIPNANLDADAIQKCWAVVSKSMTFGAIGTMNLFTKHDYSYGADFKYFYVKDGFFQSGKLTFQACDIFFVRAWYQESDIDAIIDRMQKNRKAARERDEPYEEEWKLPALRRLKEWCTEKSEESKSAGEKEHNSRSEAIEVIHGFQKGVGAKFFSWATGPEEFICERVNKDPRGKIPVNYMYTTIDFENPLGRGVIEMSGGMQNVIDSMLQSYQYNRALMLAPPIIIKGNIDKTQVKLQPNAVIKSTDTESSIEPLSLDTTALANFSQDYGLFKSQILALNNNGDTSTSSETNNPGFSKTQAGVQAQQLKLGISDNYMRKQFEAWWSDNCETMLNIHFANKHGSEEIELDADTARKVREIDPTLVDDDNMYVINYDEYTEKLKFTVDASTSDKESDEKQMENIDTILERIQNSPQLQQIVSQYPEKIAQLYNKIVNLSGVEGSDELTVDAEQFAQQMQEQQAMAQQQAQAQATMQAQSQQQMQPEDMSQQMQPEGNEIPMQQEEQQELPDMQIAEPDEQQMMAPQDNTEELTPDEIALIQGLQDRNIPDGYIEQAIIMLRQGMSDEEVLAVIAQAMQQPQEAM